MKSHWRRALAMAPLLAAALLVCVSGSAWAANVVRVEIYSPTESSPVKWVRPGSTITVTAWVTVDDAAWVTVGASVGASGWHAVTCFVSVPSASREFSVAVPLPEGIADGSKNVSVMARTDPNGIVKEASESNAVYVDGTAPVVTLGALPTTPTTNPRPTWTWSGADPEGAPDCNSGLDYYIVTLDGELPFQTTGASFTPSSNLADGAHVLKVKAVDKAGNIGLEQAFAEVVVDTTPPEVPRMPRTASPTKNTTPTWTWTAVTDLDFHHYNVYADGVKVVFTPGTEPTEGNYTSAALTHGMHVLEVTSVDSLGNESAKSAQGHVMIDLVAPDVPTMNPAPAFSKQGNITFSWSASDDDLEVKYNFQYSTDGGSTWMMTPGLAGQSAVVDAGALADGTVVSGQAMAYDAVGNESAYSASVSTTIDAVAPVVAAVTTPATPTNDPTPTWEWSVTETGSGLDYFLVTLDSELPFKTNGTLFTPSSQLVDGPHTLVVMGVDKVGNDGTPYAFTTVTIDTTPPAVPGMPRAASPTNATKQVWTWNAVTDADLDRYEIMIDGALAGPVLTPDPARSTTYTTSLGEGTHFLQVRSVDNLGNASLWSEKGYVAVDQTAPVVPVIGMVSAVPYTNASSITLIWTHIHDAVKYDVEYTIGGAATLVKDIVPQTLNVNITSAVDGNVITAKVRAYDAVGNVSGWSNVVSTTVDRTGPVVSVVTQPGSPTNNPRPTWEWLGDDDGLSGIDYYIVTLDGEPLFATRGTSFTPASNLASGSHVLKVKAVDIVGNAGAEVEFDAVVIDAAAQAAPGTPRTASPTNNQSPVWTWGAVTGATKYRVFEDEVDKGFVTVPTYTSANLTEGTHYLQVTAVDALGNESARSGAGHVEIDITPPDPPVAWFDPSAMWTNADQITLRWTAPGAAVRYEVWYLRDTDDTPQGPVGQTGQTMTIDVSAASDHGGFAGAYVYAYDAVGNRSGSSHFAGVRVDRIRPTINAVTIPASRTINPRPTWEWLGDDDGLSGIDYYIVSLDGEPPFVTRGTLFTPASDLSHGEHVLRVKAVDNAGNESRKLEFDPVIVDINAPDAPAVEAIARGYNTSPLTLKWNKVTDGENAISYTLQWAKNAGFSGAHEITVGPLEEDGTPEHKFYFTEQDKGEGEYWFRVKTISIVDADTDPAETKESGWSAIVSTIYDVTPPAAPTLTLETPARTNQSPQRWSWTAPEGAVGYEARVNSQSSGDWQDIGDACTRETTFTQSGTYTFEVRAYDWLGNKSDDNIARGRVEVDVTAPRPPTRLSLTEPEGTLIDGVLYTADGTPKVKWNGPGDAARYDIWLDGQYWIGTGSAVYEFTVVLAEGAHIVKVTAADDLGNSSIYSDPLEFVVDTTPPARPNAPETTSPTNEADQVWTWEAVADADLNRYEIMIDGVLADPVLAPNPAKSATYTTSLGEGVHFLQVRAVDNLSNTSLWSEKGYVVIDRTGPAAPVIRALPPFTNAAQLTFEWSASFDAARYELSYSRDAGASWTEAGFAGVKSDPVDIRDVSDGAAVLGRVRAYDAVGNASLWSDELPGALIASTVVDRIGPRVAMTSPTGPVATNASTFTWTWTGVDDGCGVQGYMISLDGVSWLAVADGASYIGKLCEGDNRLWVKGVDKLGNASVDAVEAAVVTQVVPQIAMVEPVPRAMEHRINDISTIAFQVVGLHDAAIQVHANLNLLEPWRIVTLMDTPTLAKFYILLDGAVMQPGPLTVTIKIGDVTRYCDYSVLNERSGFGFGRLRPW